MGAGCLQLTKVDKCRFLRRLHASERKSPQVVRESRNTHVRDQLDAAIREQESRFATLVEARRRRGDTVGFATAANLPPLLTRIRQTLLGDDFKICRHLGSSPQPVCVSLSFVETLTGYCTPCFARALRSYVSRYKYTREDNTCDECRTYSSRGVHAYTVQAGALMIVAGLCDECFTREREAVMT